MMDDTDKSLDIPEKQVIIDRRLRNMRWQSRVLLVHVGDSRWIWGTPDEDVEMVDLKDFPGFRTIDRDKEFPETIIDAGLWCFENPVEEDQINRLRADARRMAEVFGVDVKPSAVLDNARWLISDTAHASFNTEVPHIVIGSSETFVRRDAIGMAFMNNEWIHCEHVSDEDRQEWLDDKRAGAGRDGRLAPATRVNGEMSTTTKEIFPSLSASTPRPGTWPFGDAPDSMPEYLEGVISSGLELMAYSNHWCGQSGIALKGGLAIEFKLLNTVLHYMICVDQVNVRNLAAAELVTRRLLMIQRAVRRNPKAPDFEGLEFYLMHKYDESGGIVAKKLDQHIAEQQRVQATIDKQSRLFREEQEAAGKRKKDKEKGDK